MGDQTVLLRLSSTAGTLFGRNPPFVDGIGLSVPCDRPIGHQSAVFIKIIGLFTGNPIGITGCNIRHPGPHLPHFVKVIPSAADLLPSGRELTIRQKIKGLIADGIPAGYLFTGDTIADIRNPAITKRLPVSRQGFKHLLGVVGRIDAGSLFNHIIFACPQINASRETVAGRQVKPGHGIGNHLDTAFAHQPTFQNRSNPPGYRNHIRFVAIERIRPDCNQSIRVGQVCLFRRNPNQHPVIGVIQCRVINLKCRIGRVKTIFRRDVGVALHHVFSQYDPPDLHLAQIVNAGHAVRQDNRINRIADAANLLEQFGGHNSVSGKCRGISRGDIASLNRALLLRNRLSGHRYSHRYSRQTDHGNQQRGQKLLSGFCHGKPLLHKTVQLFSFLHRPVNEAAENR